MVVELRTIRGNEKIEVVTVGGDEVGDIVIGDGNTIVEMENFDLAVVGCALSGGDGKG